MRAALVLVAVAGLARADTASVVKEYAGRIVISPDPTPTLATELPAHIKANAVAGDHYELIKGPPWKLHLVGALSKDPGGQVQLVIGEDKAEPLVAVDVAAKSRLVVVNTDATTVAGFVANKTYNVQLVAKKAVLAKATLTLR